MRTLPRFPHRRRHIWRFPAAISSSAALRSLRCNIDLLSQLMRGQPLGEAIALALENTEPDFEDLAGPLQSWFQDWTAWQFFARVERPANFQK